jgi:shikimate kinase
VSLLGGLSPITLVGMSGVGKSWWTARLAAVGFRHHDCDAAIAARLGDLVRPEPGEAPVRALGRWMGMPWSDGYAEREARYLALEAEVTAAALDRALHHEAPPSTDDSAQEVRRRVVGDVIDTTGSVIHLDPTLLARLRACTRIVHLRTPPSDQERMLALYLSEPKPVVWAGVYAPAPGEPAEAALARCYPRLLAERTARYEALAHVTLDAREVAGLDVGELLARIRG